MNEQEKLAKNINDSAAFGCMTIMIIPIIVIVLAFIATIFI